MSVDVLKIESQTFSLKEETGMLFCHFGCSGVSFHEYHEPTEPSTVQAQDSDTGAEEAGEGSDTPEDESPSEGPETALQTVSSLEELLQAIEQAEAGATIGIGCEIVCPDGTVLGDTYKRVTLRRTAPEGHISTYSPDGTGNVIIQAIDFDGGNVEATTPFVQASISTAYSECHFSDCTAGAVEADNGDQNFGYCVFERNTAQYGAHIRMNGGSANLFNCVLGRGTATIRGGAGITFWNVLRPALKWS